MGEQNNTEEIKAYRGYNFVAYRLDGHSVIELQIKNFNKKIDPKERIGSKLKNEFRKYFSEGIDSRLGGEYVEIDMVNVLKIDVAGNDSGFSALCYFSHKYNERRKKEQKEFDKLRLRNCQPRVAEILKKILPLENTFYMEDYPIPEDVQQRMMRIYQ